MEKLLSQQSVDKLSDTISKDPRIAYMPFEKIVDELSLTCLKNEYQVTANVCTLEMPTGRSQEQTKDVDNCLIIHEWLSILTPAQATDERLWVSLCFNEFRDYCHARWPVEKKSKLLEKSKHISTHWFIHGTRGRMRDNCIARLWWLAHVSSKIDAWPIREVLVKLMFNSDYRASLLERPSSANSAKVITSILMLTEDSGNGEIPYKKECFRDFMKKVDFLGKRTKLASLSIDDLFKLLKPHYLRSYDSD